MGAGSQPVNQSVRPRTTSETTLKPRRLFSVAGLLAISLTIACDLPRDPEDTLARVRGGPLRVGLAKAEPWTNGSVTAPKGIEVDMVRDIARALDARIHWVAGGEGELIERLERFELDLVVAGLDDETPWADRVGLTRPYLRLHERGREVRHVLAVPPGENGWLLYVDRHLARNPAATARPTEARP